MNKFMLSFVLLIASVSMSAWALEVDSKLTLRIVKVSSSQKTVLINRGIEDGLKKNDHAKFFLSTGVVARGVAVKVSPTRSVWSLYRIVNNNYIIDDQVMKLKITTPHKITKDESRTLVTDDQTPVVGANPRELGIPLAAGADDLTPEDKLDMAKEAKELKWHEEKRKSTTTDTKIEVGLSGALEALSTTSKTSNDSFSSTETKYNVNIFAEYYLTSMGGKLENFSLMLIFANSSSQTMAFNGSAATESFSEYGGGAAYHFYSPKLLNKINPFIETNLLIGSVSSKFEPGLGATATKEDVSGSSTSISLGAGFKYFTSIGLSLRAKLEYFSRTTKYQAATTGALEFDKAQSGPRLFMGMGYRF